MTASPCLPRVSPGRRRALWSLGALLGAMGCMPAQEPTPGATAGGSFNGLDVTGAAWGRDFSLQDPQGRTRTLADFRGQVVVLFFGFTQCPDVCPTALSRAAAVMQQLGPAADRVQVIFVTVDPERDTAPVLAEYTRAFHPRFLGLMADLETTERTARTSRSSTARCPPAAATRWTTPRCPSCSTPPAGCAWPCATRPRPSSWRRT
jgi:protein SCO1/2